MAPSNSLSSLEDVRLSGDIPTDVVLIAANGARVDTHGLLCAAISPVLRAALRPSEFRESTTRAVNLDYASAATLEKMLSFACGEFGSDKRGASEMTGDDAMDLIQLADRLDITSLHETCVKVLISVLTSENAHDVYACATATGSRSHDLAVKARAVMDTGAHQGAQPHVRLRSLHDKKRKLHETRVKKKNAQKSLEKELATLETDIRNIENKISFEVEKAHQEARMAAAATSIGDGGELGEIYPHKPNRTLTVLPLPSDDDRYEDEIGMWDEQESFRSKRSKDIAETYGPGALVYGTLDEAIQASLPGDVIRLQKGEYAFPFIGSSHSFRFNKSVQLVGEKGGTKISTSWDEDGSPVINIEKCDVRISNVIIEALDNEDMIKISKGGLWLEDCVLDLSNKRNGEAAGINIGMGCSAYISRCKADKITTSAVNIDPQANEVIIDGCEFTRCGVGSEGETPRFAPGQSGAIEISCKDTDWRDSYGASVKVTVRKTTIASCFGPAVCFRIKPNVYHTSSERRFVFPSSPAVVFESNTIRSNGLSLTNPYPDGEELVRNNFPDVHERRQLQRQKRNEKRSYGS